MNEKVFRLNNNRCLEPSTVTAFFALRADDELIYWVDIAQPDPPALSGFLSPLKLHPLILEACLDSAAGSLIAPYERSLFIKLPTKVSWDPLGESFLSIICLPRAIITIHESPIAALEGIAKDFSAALRFHTLSASALLYQILDRLIDEDMAFVSKARREIESLEEVIDREPGSVQIDEILAVKRRVARLSITFEDQRYCITALQTVESEVFDIIDFREYFRDTLAHLESSLRSVARQQARLAELHQHYLLTLQDKTNKRLRLLTIISAIFMPLTLITGIYGMNFCQMPELEWVYGYPLVIAVMFTVAMALLWIFYLKGWFK